jgi:hypothetical protein
MSQKGNAVSKRQRESENEHDMLSSSLALLLFISFHCCCVYFAFSVVPAFNATVCVSNLKLCEQESNNSPRMAAWQNAHRSNNKQQGGRSSTTGFLEASEDAFVHEKPPQSSYNDDVKEKGTENSSGWTFLSVRYARV